MKQAELYRKEKGKIRCLGCSHKCLISEGKTGICGIRKNVNGRLMLLTYGNVISMNVDSIEKKPLYHFLSGSKVFSIGTFGCNFRCEFCQNHSISQFKDYGNEEILEEGIKVSPEEIVEEALENGCESIAYTYTEPIIAIEFFKEVCRIAKDRGLKNIFVTNGYWSEESFDYIKEYVDAMNIDLKAFKESSYKKYCGGRLQPVLDTIKRAYEYGIHIEITSLVIPGLNDSDDELREIAEFIVGLDKNIPWHISRFFPMFKMRDRRVTPVEILRRAERIGKEVGLKNIHIGNV